MDLYVALGGFCLVLVLAVSCALALQRLLRDKNTVTAEDHRADASPDRTEHLLTPVHRAVLESLERVVHEPLLAAAGTGRTSDPDRGEHTRVAAQTWARIFVGVPISAMVDIPETLARQWPQGREKAIDFILCETGTLRPLVAITLETSMPDQCAGFIEEMFDGAGIPLVRWPLDRPGEQLAEVVMGEIERGVIGS